MNYPGIAAEIVESRISRDAAIQDLTFALINYAGHKFRGHQGRMAEALGMNRVSLCKVIRMMRVLGIAEGRIAIPYSTQSCRRDVPRSTTSVAHENITNSLCSENH